MYQVFRSVLIMRNTKLPKMQNVCMCNLTITTVGSLWDMCNNVTTEPCCGHEQKIRNSYARDSMSCSGDSKSCTRDSRSCARNMRTKHAITSQVQFSRDRPGRWIGLDKPHSLNGISSSSSSVFCS